jgi:2-polyprenyl-3-methyl-5-hydroxy-6-metoxy-1,4-benzoquinol methylase
MKVTDIIKISEKPVLYDKGTAFMWTDKHISRQLLNIHLNPDTDLASRKLTTIIRTAKWILDTATSEKKHNILDLGCGPGLYAELFAHRGHQVTGIDVSESSIDHAMKSAKEMQYAIKYKQASYLETDLGTDLYDLVVLIYTDLGVLTPLERELLIEKIYRALKKGGLFIFDVLKDTDLESRCSPKNWETSDKGFWKDSPYLALSESFLYEEQKVILYQHIIADMEDKTEIYRFWTHFFSESDIIKMLEPQGFSNIRFRDDILPEADIWSGKNVLFSIATK